MNKEDSIKYFDKFYNISEQILPMDGVDDKLITMEDLRNNFNEVFMGMLFTFNTVFNNLTGEDADILEFTHVLNRLAVEYLMENGTLLEGEPDDCVVKRECDELNSDSVYIEYDATNDINEYDEDNEVSKYVRKFLN